jgi:hypothetical protein
MCFSVEREEVLNAFELAELEDDADDAAALNPSRAAATDPPELRIAAHDASVEVAVDADRFTLRHDMIYAVPATGTGKRNGKALYNHRRVVSETVEEHAHAAVARSSAGGRSVYEADAEEQRRYDHAHGDVDVDPFPSATTRSIASSSSEFDRTEADMDAEVSRSEASLAAAVARTLHLSQSLEVVDEYDSVEVAMLPR